MEQSKTTISGRCVITGEDYAVTVNTLDYIAWKNRKVLAQNAFPYLSKEDREFIISRISPKGWEQIYDVP